MVRELPDWFDTIVGRLSAMFSLGHWRIHLYPENADKKPEGNEGCAGLSEMDTNYHDARIYLDRDLEPDEFGFEVLAHEVLHLVFADMRDLVHDISQFVFDDEQRKTLFDMYDRCEEQTITRLARGMARDFDFSYWLKPKEAAVAIPATATAHAEPIETSGPGASTQPRYWLISDEDVQLMTHLLEEMAGLGDMRVVRLRYTFDTGLHKTDAVPSDGAEGADE